MPVVLASEEGVPSPRSVRLVLRVRGRVSGQLGGLGPVVGHRHYGFALCSVPGILDFSTTDGGSCARWCPPTEVVRVG